MIKFIIQNFVRKEYHHFRDYVEYDESKMHPFDYGNNKNKIEFDKRVADFRKKYLNQILCTECFYYYPKEEMIYTDKPYVEVGLDSEYWFYCSNECIDYRKNLNKFV